MQNCAMNNGANIFSLVTKNISYVSITCLTTLTFLTGMIKPADAATIEFDADTYAFANPNTCTPQLPDTGAKCFVEDGVNVEAFSAQQIGMPSAFSVKAHIFMLVCPMKHNILVSLMRL